MKRLLLILCALGLMISSAEAGTGKKRKRVHHKRTTHHAPVKRTYYGRNTSYKFKETDAGRPSPYKGDKVPENDGQRKNMERNLNYGNSQPLPPNDGGRR